MKCRPVVHTRFTAVSCLVALVYRGVINDVTLSVCDKRWRTERSLDNRGYATNVAVADIKRGASKLASSHTQT